jgi:hypothetical protein
MTKADIVERDYESASSKLDSAKNLDANYVGELREEIRKGQATRDTAIKTLLDKVRTHLANGDVAAALASAQELAKKYPKRADLGALVKCLEILQDAKTFQSDATTRLGAAVARVPAASVTSGGGGVGEISETQTTKSKRPQAESIQKQTTPLINAVYGNLKDTLLRELAPEKLPALPQRLPTLLQKLSADLDAAKVPIEKNIQDVGNLR